MSNQLTFEKSPVESVLDVMLDGAWIAGIDNDPAGEILVAWGIGDDWHTRDFPSIDAAKAFVTANALAMQSGEPIGETP